MKFRSEVLVDTEDSIDYRDNFAQFLIESERSAYAIKNYLCDLDGFALWLKSKGNTEFTRIQSLPITMMSAWQD